jgi:hypothetical protein
MISVSASGAAVGSGEPEAGEVGLEGLVGLFGFKADVETLRTLRRLGVTCLARTRIRLIVALERVIVWVVVQVPADGVGAGVQAGLAQLFAELEHEFDR